MFERIVSGAAIFAALVCLTSSAEAADDVATLRPLKPVPLARVTIDDPFWSPKLAVWRKVTIADCFDKFERDGALENFDRVARGEVNARHGGPQWYDGLVYEMIRGTADFLAQQPDAAIKARVDGYVNRIAAAAARDPDGYLNTHTQLREPSHRWGQNGGNDRDQHDLYNAGCLVEAAVHYYRATGETKLLTTAVRMANGMCKVMGPPPRRNIIPGHALGEESFTRLYELFRDEPGLGAKLGVPVNAEAYLELARFWVDARGHHDGRRDFGEYGQDHVPVLEQRTIEGHAVRATLLATGVTAVGVAASRPAYVDAAQALWGNMATRRLYLTGGVGAVAADERFGGDFVLPNDGYLETCAAVANVFFNQNLALATADGAKVDELERSLYNAALAGVSLAGNRYFYENPLRAGRGRARWAWHACPCCPPMFLKLMGALPGYVYATGPSAVYVNLFVGSRGSMDVADSEGRAVNVRVEQQTRYPWEGGVRVAVNPARAATFDLFVRVPAWARGGKTNGGLYDIGPASAPPLTLAVNGAPVDAGDVVRGYVKVRRAWRAGDAVEVRFDMPVRRVAADARVEADRGRVALMRGPVVYCIESADHAGRPLSDVFLPAGAEVAAERRPELLGDITVLKAKARRATLGGGDEAAEVTAIPYYANANRGPVEMRTWLAASAAGATPLTIAALATPSASHCFANDTAWAMNDPAAAAPKDSADDSRRRFTWWDHRGTAEWAQYDFDAPHRVGAVEVYWWDETRVKRQCRVPQSWRLVYKAADGSWTPVKARGEFGVRANGFNVTEFEPIETTALRIEAQLQPDWSGGILRWQVTPAPAAVGK